MSYTITRLDNRHSWHSQFDYMIRFDKPTGYSAGTGVLEFDRARRWFNRTYGWSQDVESQHHIAKIKAKEPGYVNTEDLNAHWAYSVAYNDYRIYVKSEKELEWFILSHPSITKS